MKYFFVQFFPFVQGLFAFLVLQKRKWRVASTLAMRGQMAMFLGLCLFGVLFLTA
jgi:hypothetical protein